MKPINNFLTHLISVPDDRAWHRSLICDWNSIMGHLHTKVHLEKIDGTMLILGVYDACWMQELYLMSPLLIRTINKKLDGEYIKQVRFKKLGKRTALKPTQQKKIVAPLRDVSFNTRELQALNRIEDAQLQAALKQFLIRCYKEK